MKKLLLLAAVFLMWSSKPAMAMADMAEAESNAYFEIGPLNLTIPFKTAEVVYLFNALDNTGTERNLIGGETTIFTVWDRVSGTVGVVTSPSGNGTFFIGADVNTGNALDRFLSLGPIRIGGFGAYDSRNDSWMAGPKASLALW